MPTVIKAGQVGQLKNNISSVRLIDHFAEAKKAVESAKRQAEQTLAQAKQEKDRVFEEAKKKGEKVGFEEGYEVGKEKGNRDAYQDAEKKFQQEQADLIANMERVISEVDADRDHLRIAAERNLLEFAVSLASKLTFAMGKENHESVIENVKRAIMLIGTKTDLTVHVHPDDLSSMEKFSQSIVKQLGESIAFHVHADESVTQGGCKISNEKTDIDAQLETQVDELVTMLIGSKADHG